MEEDAEWADQFSEAASDGNIPFMKALIESKRLELEEARNEKYPSKNKIDFLTARWIAATDLLACHVTIQHKM